MGECRKPLSQAEIRSLIVVSALYGLLRWLLLAGMEPLWHSDSASYWGQYESGLGGGILERGRPWGYPLLIWLLGHRDGLVVSFQRFVAIGAWLALAWAICSMARTKPGRITGFGSILAVSLSLNLIQWDVSILTESLTISLLLLLMACWAILLRSVRFRPWTLGAFAALACLWAGLRDANNLMLPIFALLLTLEPLRFLKGENRTAFKRRQIQNMLGAVAMMFVFAGHQIEVAESQRSWPNFGNAIALRGIVREIEPGVYIQDQANIDWLRRHYQLPDEAVRRGSYVTMDPPISADYQTWLKEKGTRAWPHFVVAHPWWALKLCLRFKPFAGEEMTLYLQRRAHPEIWTNSRMAFPDCIQEVLSLTLGELLGSRLIHGALLLCAMASGILWLFLLFRKPESPMLPPAGILFLCFTVGALSIAVSILGDAIEEWRHAIAGIAALNIAYCSSLAVAADYLTIGLQRLRR